MMGMSRRFFCDRCGCEISESEMVKLLEYDLCKSCCRVTMKNEQGP